MTRHPLVCAAASKIFDLYEELGILENVRSTGDYLYETLERFAKEYKEVIGHRGIGLMQGLEFSMPVSDIIKSAQAKGLILINAGSNILRFVPPLICTKENVDEMAAIMEEVMKDLNA